MKKSIEILFTHDDKDNFSREIRAVFPYVAFIDDVYWPTPTPPSRASITDFESKFVLIWNRQIFPKRFQTFEVKDAINQVYTFNYDPLGRLLSQTRAGGTMTFEYDAVGNRGKRTDYAGRVTDYTFDKLNRLTKIEYDPGAGNAIDKPQSTYGYDDISRLTSAVNEVGTVAFTHDNRNWLKTETDVFGHLVEFGYDAASNRNQLKLNGSVHTSYAYDDANRLTTLMDEASRNFDFGYDNADPGVLHIRNY